MSQTLCSAQAVQNADLATASKPYQRVIMAPKAAGSAPVLLSE